MVPQSNARAKVPRPTNKLAGSFQAGSLRYGLRCLKYEEHHQKPPVNVPHKRNYRRAAVTTCLAWAFFVTLSRAEEPKRELLVEHVPPSIIAASAAPTNFIASIEAAPAIDGEEPARLMKKPQPRLTEGERWEKFEAEFGLKQKNPSLFKGSLESAKYRVDRTTFALNEFVQNVESALSFDYGLRPVGSTNTTTRGAATSPIPLWDAVQNARFKSDIDLNVPGGRAFVGVRLVLPIGD
jgi:hypothetical protein